MGFFDFFKKKESEQVIEKISVDNLGSWILNKEKQTEKNQQDFLNSISNRVFQLIQEIEQQIEVLEKIDLSKKKVVERIKSTVKINLNNYIYHLRKLISDLKNCDKRSNEVIKNLDLVFSNFEKKSIMSFQKATFLIGDELEKVRDCILGFSRDLKKILDKNKDFIKELEKISYINSRIKEISEADKIVQEIDKSILDVREEIVILDNKNKALDAEIEQIMNSKEYLDQKEKKQDLEKKKQDLETCFSELKSLVDFKRLSSLFHSNEREMRIIKEHKNNFRESFENDKGVGLSRLYDGESLETKQVLDKIKQINELNNEVNSLIIKDLTNDLGKNKKKNNTKVLDFESEIIKQEKRSEKIKENKKGILDLMKQELIKWDIKLVC